MGQWPIVSITKTETLQRAFAKKKHNVLFSLLFFFLCPLVFSRVQWHLNVERILIAALSVHNLCCTLYDHVNNFIWSNFRYNLYCISVRFFYYCNHVCNKVIKFYERRTDAMCLADTTPPVNLVEILLVIWMIVCIFCGFARWKTKQTLSDNRCGYWIQWNCLCSSVSVADFTVVFFLCRKFNQLDDWTVLRIYRTIYTWYWFRSKGICDHIETPIETTYVINSTLSHPKIVLCNWILILPSLSTL